MDAALTGYFTKIPHGLIKTDTTGDVPLLMVFVHLRAAETSYKDNKYISCLCQNVPVGLHCTCRTGL